MNRGEALQLAPGISTEAQKFHELPGWEQHRARAQALGASGARILGGISAAVVWEMWVRAGAATPVEYYSRHRKADATWGRQLRGRLPQTHYVRGRTATVTNIPRTIIDLGRFHGFEACFMGMTWALHHDKTTVAEVSSLLTPSLEAGGVIRQVLASADGRVESAAEAYLYAQVKKAGEISLIPQASIMDAFGVLRRADFQLENTRYLVEVAGMSKYGTTDSERDAKLRREKRRIDGLATAGYVLLNYTAREVFLGNAYCDLLWRARGLTG